MFRTWYLLVLQTAGTQFAAAVAQTVLAKQEASGRRLADRADFCEDSAAGWHDSAGNGCTAYWGDGDRCSDASAFGVEGVDAAQVCCACGGGTCLDDTTWTDADGWDCQHYRASGWCADEGYGPNWDMQVWGSFCNSSGVAASEACCGCGRGRLYATSMDSIFEQPRCFATNVSLADRGIMSTYSGCQPPADDSYSGGFRRRRFFDPCLSQWAYLYYSCQEAPENPGTTSTSTSSSTASTSTSTSTSTSSPPGRNFMSWIHQSASSVEHLDLAGNANALCGDVPATFKRFHNLRLLNLSNCGLSGDLPEFLADLPLRDLDLSHNDFEGEVPSAWAQLSLLTTLDLSGNRLGQQTMSELDAISFLAGAPLEVLRLHGYAGTISPWSSWQASRGLRVLELKLWQDNRDTITFFDNPFARPSFNLDSFWMKAQPLEELRISGGDDYAVVLMDVASFCPTRPALKKLHFNNILPGDVFETSGGFGAPVTFTYVATPFALPVCWAALPLEELVLHRVGVYEGNFFDRRFEVRIPDDFRNLTLLRKLDLGSTGVVGLWPSWIGDLSRLEELDLSKPEGWKRLEEPLRFHGSLPDSWGNLKTTLRKIHIDGNDVNASLPGWISEFEQLTHLTAKDSGFFGRLPSLAGLVSLEVLDLSGNSLSGSFPPLDTWTRMRVLKLGGNSHLSLVLPDSIDALSSLEVLDLRGLALAGTLPANVGQLTLLTELLLQDTQLSGTLPAALGQLEELLVLNISSAALRGTLPPELGSLPRLRQLGLGGAGLTGSLPDAFFQLTELVEFQLQGAAELTGTLPALVISLSKLKKLSITGSKMRGSLPDALFQWPLMLESLVLSDNAFTGTLPASLQWASFCDLDWSTGEVIGLCELALARNNFEGELGGEFGPLKPGESWGVRTPKQLLLLDIQGNSFNGTLPLLQAPESSATSATLNLDIFARDCNLDAVEGVAESLRYLDLSHNRLTEVPGFVARSAWEQSPIPRLKTLLLQGNAISSWPEDVACMRDLEIVDVSDNPLRSDVQSFLDALARNGGFNDNDGSGDYRGCGSLITLIRAQNASLNGSFIRLVRTDATLGGERVAESLFPGLTELDLSSNAISSVTALPKDTPTLSVARFNDNQLTFIHRQWFGEELDPATGFARSPVRVLNISDNNNLMFTVDLPAGLCTAVLPGARMAANPQAYAPWVPSSSGDGSIPVECTVPCSPYSGSLIADPGYPDVASLCRCSPGFGLLPDAPCYDEHYRDPNTSFSCTELLAQGSCQQVAGAERCCECGGEGGGVNALNCERCPLDTHAFTEDPLRLRSECRQCPPHSSTETKTGVADLCGCKCEKGWYLSTSTSCDSIGAEGVCIDCGYISTTNSSGSTAASDCFCDPAVTDIILQDGICGCDQKHFLNHVTRACETCSDEGEICDWVYPRGIRNSTLPPDLKPGFWASTGYLAGQTDLDAIKSFKGHSIYKCYSAKTCIDNVGTCARGREGVACSLCVPGYSGSADGPCSKCEGSVIAAIIGLFALTPFIVMAAHFLLSGSASSRGTLSALRSFRVSARQLIKHLQVVTVVSGFTISWPKDVEKVFADVAIFDLNFIDAAGLGCLGHQQTASLEFGLRYLFPCIFVLLGVVTTPFVAVPVAWLLKLMPFEWAQKAAKKGHLSFQTSMRAVYWIVVLFFPTFLENGLRLFTCNIQPNEEVTVATFPHLHCFTSKSGHDDEWLQLFPAGLAYTGLCLGGLFGYYYLVYRCTWHEMEASDFQSRGDYDFLFEDFRDSAVHWPILLLCRDVYINAVGTALNNYGAWQLLLVSGGMLVLGYFCIKQNPYQDASNTAVEVVNALFVFAICMFTAGMGFTQAPGLEDMATLAKGEETQRGEDIMTMRARILLALQLASLIGPFLVIAYQLVLLVPCLVKMLPESLKPLQEADEAALRTYLRETLHIAEGDQVNARNVDKMLSRLDTHELQQLVNVLLTSPAASKGVLRDAGSSTNLSKLLRQANTAKNRTNSHGGTSASSPSPESSPRIEAKHGSRVGELEKLLEHEKQQNREHSQEIKKLLQLLQQHAIPIPQGDEAVTPSIPESTNPGSPGIEGSVINV